MKVTLVEDQGRVLTSSPLGVGPAVWTRLIVCRVLNNGGNPLAINAFYLQIAIGVLILAAVGFDQPNPDRGS